MAESAAAAPKLLAGLTCASCAGTIDVQEGLTNVWRHAQATKVKVRLVASFPKIILRMEDNGKGFDVSRQEGRLAAGTRLGLLGMRERVSFLGGEMKMDSQPQKGTRISIEIPWKEGDHGPPEENLHC